MSPSPLPPPCSPHAVALRQSAPREHIIATARELLFNKGVAAMTMDALASELGMSKKTLYLHFKGKDELLCAIIESIAEALQEQVAAVQANRTLPPSERLRQVIDIVGQANSRTSPAMLRDLQRYAPAAFARIDEIRRRNIPKFLERLLRDGIRDGSVRPDLDPEFSIEFWMHAVRGCLDVAQLERHHMTAHQALQKTADLFFRGVLTAEGQKNFTAIQ